MGAIFKVLKVVDRARFAIIAAALVVSLVGNSMVFVGRAHADGPSWDGDGSEETPWLLTDCADLWWVGALMADSPGTFSDNNFKQTGNINCADWDGDDFLPIGGPGWSNPFTGSFDGGGYTIDGLSIAMVEESDSPSVVGLFGATDGATLQGINLKNLTVDADIVTGYVGGLVGYVSSLEHASSIKRSSVEGTITVVMSGADQSPAVGGLVGAMAPATLEDSYANVAVDATVTATDASYSNQLLAGALVGYVGDAESMVTRSYGAGSVHASGGKLVAAAGLAGRFFDGTVENSFAAVTGLLAISGISEPDVHVATFLGHTTDVVSDNNYVLDMQETATVAGDPIDGLVAIDEYDPGIDFFKDASNPPLDGWNFDTIWGLNADINDGLPYLLGPGDAPNDEGTLTLLPGNDSAKIVQVSQTTCASLGSGSVSDESGLSVQDAGYTYPSGLVGFTASGCGTGGTTVITLIFTGSFDESKVLVRKYNPNTNGFTTINGATKTQTILSGHPALQVSYSITDGGELDQDGTVNGVIVDPAGLAVQAVGAPNTGVQNIMALFRKK